MREKSVFSNIGWNKITIILEGTITEKLKLHFFLGPRGPLVLPSVGLFVPSRAKNLHHLYTGIFAL